MTLVATYTSGDTYEEQCLLLLQSELAKLDIELEVRGMPTSSKYSKADRKSVV